MDFGKMKQKKMGDSEKTAKLTALKEAHKMASDMMKEDLSGLKKVTVASDSKSGLKKGLEKAEEILGSKSEEDCEDEDHVMSDKEEDKQDGYEDQQDESQPMDIDELEQKIQELMKMKEKLQK